VKVKDGAAIKVLGTEFNIMTYRDEQDTKTTLVKGSVKVTNGNFNVMLQPGQQALSKTGNSSAPVIINQYPNMEEVLGWKNGVFQFANADLRLVMRQVARWYDVEVKFDDRVPEVHFSGRISRSLKASELLSGIEYVGVHFKIEGKKVLVLP
jgi:ferric-dicitrate binding protein FerR (iron transport regulator)